MGCLLLTLTGGEIFIKKSIFDILRHAHERGFVLELLTSATPLTPDKISVLAELNVGRVQVSIYSHLAEIHDNFTGSIGSWRRSVDAIRLMVESQLHVELVCSIVPDNYRDLAKIKDTCRVVGSVLQLRLSDHFTDRRKSRHTFPSSRQRANAACNLFGAKLLSMPEPKKQKRSDLPSRR